jgi:hypothetical protein
MSRRLLHPFVAAAGLVLVPSSVWAGKLTVDLGDAQGIALVGVFNRWDADGNHRREVNPKAKIGAPEIDAQATPAGQGKYEFANLPPGRYDLVIMRGDKLRIEGFTFPPVLEFDPFFTAADEIDAEARDWIVEDIGKARHYENKVVPLCLGGDEKVIRVLVMLIRDLPTSYEADMPGAATMRFEVWQYDWKYGGWVKNKRTKVLHRVILPRDELRQWTWVWDPMLGGIEVTAAAKTVKYQLPKPADGSLKGLRPY